MAALISFAALVGCGEGASVSGRIVDPIQRPIEDAWVKAVFNFECCDGPYESWVEKCGRTDGDGDFGLSATKNFADLSGDEHVATEVTIWAQGYRRHHVYWSAYDGGWDDAVTEESELCTPFCELERCFEGDDCMLAEEPPDDWCEDGKWESY